MEAVEELQSKIRTLEHENRLLKERLDEAGVSYADSSGASGNNIWL